MFDGRLYRDWEGEKWERMSEALQKSIKNALKADGKLENRFCNGKMSAGELAAGREIINLGLYVAYSRVFAKEGLLERASGVLEGAKEHKKAVQMSHLAKKAEKIYEIAVLNLKKYAI